MRLVLPEQGFHIFNFLGEIDVNILLELIDKEAIRIAHGCLIFFEHFFELCNDLDNLIGLLVNRGFEFSDICDLFINFILQYLGLLWSELSQQDLEV